MWWALDLPTFASTEPAPVDRIGPWTAGQENVFLMPRRRAIAKPVGNFDGGVLEGGFLATHLRSPSPPHTSRMDKRARTIPCSVPEDRMRSARAGAQNPPSIMHRRIAGLGTVFRIHRIP